MFKIIVGIMLLTIASGAEAMPSQVIIIRHAEKPVVGNELSLEGQNRAAALATFFTKDPQVLRYGTPVALFAPRPGKEDGSVRSIETLEPLAAFLKMNINKQYTPNEFLPMVETIKTNPAYAGKMVLICWEHHLIPEIAHAFGAMQAPRKWHGKVFDRVWILSFNPGGQVAFQDIPEQLPWR